MIETCDIYTLRSDPDYPALSKEYEKEVRTAAWGSRHLEPVWPAVFEMEAAGALQVFRARVEGRLVGWLILESSPDVSFGTWACSVFHVFATHSMRSRVGPALLRTAIRAAKKEGLPLRISGQVGTPLWAELQASRRFAPIEVVFQLKG